MLVYELGCREGIVFRCCLHMCVATAMRLFPGSLLIGKSRAYPLLRRGLHSVRLEDDESHRKRLF